MRQTFLVVTMWAAAALPCAHAGAAFYAIGPDAGFIPDQLVSVTTVPPGVNPIATMGGAVLGFNGGLTEGPGAVLYAIANDSGANGSLYTVAADGTLGLVGAAGGLGVGFFGGLAYDAANATFYAAANDNSNNTTLYSISGGGVTAIAIPNLGTAFSGLAYDTANGLFYGIGIDNSGASALYDFPLAGPASFVAELGFGFGALTYDAANDVLWAIDPVSNAGSQLVQVSTAGIVSAPFLTLGDGFTELAVIPISTQTPEPATPAMLGAGLTLVGLLFRRRA